MHKYKNLYLIGTSHISIESIKEVKKAFKTINPDILALELDKKRLLALISAKKTKLSLKELKKLGLKAYLFNLLGAYAEKKLGSSVGIKPGTEMKIAYSLAKKQKAKIALIDQDIEITLKKLSSRLTWKEKFTFIKDILKALILRKQEIKFDLRKVPSEEQIRIMIDKVKNSYPSFYLTLVKERNIYMAKALKTLIAHNKSRKILALIGAGHEKTLLSLIKKHV